MVLHAFLVRVNSFGLPFLQICLLGISVDALRSFTGAVISRVYDGVDLCIQLLVQSITVAGTEASIFPVWNVPNFFI